VLGPTTGASVKVLSPSAREKVLYAFRGGKDGSSPIGALIHIQSAFYGTTLTGGGSSRCGSSNYGAADCGTVFKLAPSGSGYTESVLYRFKGGSDGGAPWAGLTAGSGGVLFGTTESGGMKRCTNPYKPAGCGTVFMLTPSATGYTKSTIYAFKGLTDGANPLGTLLLDGSGALYGTTEFGGNATCSKPLGSGCGTVFKLTPSAQGYVKTTVYNFAGGTDGANPYGNLILDAHGVFYSTAAYGGNTGCGIGCGAVFSILPTTTGYSERVLYRFKGGKDGQFPKAGLTIDASGALYGTTNAGGNGSCTNYVNLNGCGTVFKLKPSRGKYTESILYRFRGTSDGAWSYSGLIWGQGGTLYGAALLGGKGSCDVAPLDGQCGTVFKLTGAGTTYTLSTLYAFRGATGGALPYAGPILVKGLLYGTTSSGEGGRCTAPGCGTVYKLRP
jgi:uncharacterized repeat protein (TIGR03803 family)